MGVQKFRVLVIDDERAFADSLARILDMFGYDASTAYTAIDALERIGVQPCDLVVSDVVLDGDMSGIDIAIEFSKRLPKCRVLLMSGDDATAALLEEAKEKGYSFDVLPKPVHPSTVLEHLKLLTISE